MTDYLISDVLVYENELNGRVTGDILLKNVQMDFEHVTCDVEYVVNDNGIIDTYSAEDVSLVGGGGGGGPFVLSELIVQNTGTLQRTLNLPVYYPDQGVLWTTLAINGGTTLTCNLVIPAEGKLTARVSTSYTITGNAQRIGSDYVEFTPGTATITVS